MGLFIVFIVISLCILGYLKPKKKVIKTLNVARDFSTEPGARYTLSGPYSAEEFLNTVLEPYYESLFEDELLEINLDGTIGYAYSFLDEAFGGLARRHGKENILKKLVFVSDEEPYLIDEIKEIINKCWVR
jgi:hypothetical protein